MAPGKNLVEAVTFSESTVANIVRSYKDCVLKADGVASSISIITGTTTTMCILEPGTYTASFELVSGSCSKGSNSSYPCWQFFSTSGTLLASQLSLASAGSRTLTITETTTVALRFIAYAGNVFDNFVIRIQLEAGSTATAYEPYHDPEVKRVYASRDSRNLFNYSGITSWTISGVTLERHGDGLRLHGNPAITSGYISFTLPSITCDTSKYYQMSINNKIAGVGFISGVYGGGSNLTLDDTAFVKCAKPSSVTTGNQIINVRYDVGDIDIYLEPMLVTLDAWSVDAVPFEPYGTVFDIVYDKDS